MLYLNIKQSETQTDSIPLNRLVFSIGAETNADIRHPELSLNHGELRFENAEWIFRKLNPNAFAEFQTIPITLKKINSGEILNLGPIQLEFLGDYNNSKLISKTDKTELFTRLKTSGVAELFIIKGPMKGKRFTLISGDYLIGRGSKVKPIDITIHDPFLSKQHAKLSIQSDTITIDDLNSKNGIRCGFRRKQHFEIRHNDVIKMGKSAIQIRRIHPHSSETVLISQTKWCSSRNCIFLCSFIFLITLICLLFVYCQL